MSDFKDSTQSSSATPIRVGKSEIRPFTDQVAVRAYQSSTEKRISFNPRGSYKPGRFPGLERALNRLEKESEKLEASR